MAINKNSMLLVVHLREHAGLNFVLEELKVVTFNLTLLSILSD